MNRWPRHLIVVAAVAWSRPSIGDDLDAPDATLDPTTANWNEWSTDLFSIRVGAGVIVDYVAYAQSEDSKEQMTLQAVGQIRDARVVVSGRLPWDRLTYTLSYMFDSGADEFRWRQTGLKLQVPELSGYLFVGRTKEGFSTSKLTVGYYGWFAERAAVNEAFIPILADGIRWIGTGFGGKLVYNLGVFADEAFDEEPFVKNDWQGVGRAVWLPLAGDEDEPILHLATELRYAGANDGFLEYKAKPEVFEAQSFAVDTGMFEADRSTMVGVEAYYLAGPFSLGSEYFFNWVSSTPANDPFFHGGEAFVGYILTGESHGYNDKGAFFQEVVPARPLKDGGAGAWELALRVSYVDLDDGPIQGGTFMRITPILNWYASTSVRFEALYGVGVLDRDDIVGVTQFIQTRLQITVL